MTITRALPCKPRSAASSCDRIHAPWPSVQVGMIARARPVARAGVVLRSPLVRQLHPARARRKTIMATIVIDPGHGGSEDLLGSSANHAVGPNGTLEKTLTLDVA